MLHGVLKYQIIKGSLLGSRISCPCLEVYVVCVCVICYCERLATYTTCIIHSNIIGCVWHADDSSKQKNNDTKSSKQRNISLVLISY